MDIRRRFSPTAKNLASFLLLLFVPGLSLAQSGLHFNGTSQYVTFGQATSTLGASTFTLECWFNWTGGGSSTTTGANGLAAVIPLVSKGRGEADGDDRDMNYLLGIQSGKLAVDFEEGVGGPGPLGNNHPLIGRTSVAANAWHHAAATYDGQVWKLYYDGVLDTAHDLGQSCPPRSDSRQHAAVASALTTAPTPAGFFFGSIDEVRIWNYARSQSEIQASLFAELTSGTGLLGRWGLNEGAGTTTVNSVAGSPEGMLMNTPAWAGGAPFEHEALRLGPLTAYVTYGNAPSLRLGQFTLECWMKRTGPGASASTGTGGLLAVPLITKGVGEADSPDSVNMNYFLGIQGTDSLLAADFEEPTGPNHPIVGITPIRTGQWYHVAAAYDGTTWELYLDGFLEATAIAGAGPAAISVQHAGLGAALNSSGVASGHFDGIIDEVRIWDYARTAQEIQATMSTQLSSPQAGLVGRWGLDDGPFSGLVHSTAGTTIDGAILGTGWSWTAGAPFNSSTVIVDITTIPSWNMVSVPVTVGDPRKSTLFPTALSSAYAAIPGGGYLARDTLFCGVGYWLKFAGVETIPVRGARRERDTLEVVGGWNLVGSITASVPSLAVVQIPPGVLATGFYKYTTTGYGLSASIEPGGAYWVKASGPGQLILASPASLGKGVRSRE